MTNLAPEFETPMAEDAAPISSLLKEALKNPFIVIPVGTLAAIGVGLLIVLSR